MVEDKRRTPVALSKISPPIASSFDLSLKDIPRAKAKELHQPNTSKRTQDSSPYHLRISSFSSLVNRWHVPYFPYPGMW